MAIAKVLVTGSSGLVGSEAVRFFTGIGAQVVGLDNNSRGRWFGSDGSVTAITSELQQLKNYRHVATSILDRDGLKGLYRQESPDLVVHCAAQPSHDKSASIPWEDFLVNATGTMNLLETTREHCPESPFVYVSTNKVYGDKPNSLDLIEGNLRFDYSDARYANGIDESMSIDQCLHSPFGASKASADLMVQEYGRYFGLPTVCFRCGCITGASHQGVELHGFLNYLCRTAKRGNRFTIYGHKGKQVRDNIHARDLVGAFYEFYKSPRSGEVYNLGGGKSNSCSILEAIEMIGEKTGLKVETIDGPARKGDHICYYTDFSKFRSHYPGWNITESLGDILDEMLDSK